MWLGISNNIKDKNNAGIAFKINKNDATTMSSVSPMVPSSVFYAAEEQPPEVFYRNRCS